MAPGAEQLVVGRRLFVMRVDKAKEIAKEWVQAEGSRTPGFAGAFFHGSVNWLPDEGMLDPSSDLDIMLVIEGEQPSVKLGKLTYRGVILEVSYLSADAVATPQSVLGEYNLAGSFHKPSVIQDPTGKLCSLQRAVAAEYANEIWVRIRCRQALDKVFRGLSTLDENAPFHEQAMAWLFSSSIMTHVILVAGLRNPTVRLRYVAARRMLEQIGRLDVYPMLIDALDPYQLNQQRTAIHLSNLTVAYDAATQAIRTPFFFASDISESARTIAIDGSRSLIETGMHREALFWICATYSRCMMIFAADAPNSISEYEPGYRALFSELGIRTFCDMRTRASQVQEELPHLWAVAEEIILDSPEIVRE